MIDRKRRRIRWGFLAVAWLLVVVFALWVLEGRAQGDYRVYLPIVRVEPLPLRPTLTPTIIATSTPTPTATPMPQWLSFLTGYDDRRMKGLPIGGVRRTSMTNYWGSVVYPKGVFIVLFMDVVNCELTSGYVSGIGTFWMRDGSGPFFDMTGLDAQMAAEHEYRRMGTYEDLQPQFVYEMVFVFDVPPQGSYNLWYRPWSSGRAVQIEEKGIAAILDEFVLDHFSVEY